MAERPKGYSGQGYSLRGDKSRFVLPPAFRKAVAGDGERILCLAKHDRWPCMTGFGLARTDLFEAQLDREEDSALRLGREFDREMRSVQLWGFTEIPFDASGRFVLPDHLAELGGLGDAIYFQGAGQFITMWDPQRLYDMGAGWEGAQATCRKLAAEGGAKKK